MKITIDLRHTRTRAFLGVLAAAIAVPLVAYAGLDINHQVSLTTFSSGTTISSSQVNANFASLQAAVSELQQFIIGSNTNPAGATQLLATDSGGALSLGGNLNVNNIFMVASLNGGSGSMTITSAGGVSMPTTLSANAITVNSGGNLTAPTVNATTLVTDTINSTAPTTGTITLSSGTVTTTGNVNVGSSGQATLTAGTIDAQNVTLSSNLSASGGTFSSVNTVTLSCTGAKSFVQAHPTDDKKVVVYVCLEGGEAGVYCRGSGQLVGGRATIALPDHFALVTNAERGLTAQVTPTGDCRGIFVVAKSPTQLEVQELAGGASDASFDWTVNGLRKGFESHEPIQDKAKFPTLFPATKVESAAPAPRPALAR